MHTYTKSIHGRDKIGVYISIQTTRSITNRVIANQLGNAEVISILKTKKVGIKCQSSNSSLCTHTYIQYIYMQYMIIMKNLIYHFPTCYMPIL